MATDIPKCSVCGRVPGGTQPCRAWQSFYVGASQHFPGDVCFDCVDEGDGGGRIKELFWRRVAQADKGKLADVLGISKRTLIRWVAKIRSDQAAIVHFRRVHGPPLDWITETKDPNTRGFESPKNERYIDD